MADERDRLRDALDPSDSASAQCISSLDNGATIRVFEHTASRDNLKTIYTRRVEHLARIDARTTGSADLVARLGSAEPRLRLATVDDDQWHFVVFLDTTTGRAAAVWGVDASLGDGESTG